MDFELSPANEIESHAATLEGLTDSQVLERLTALSPLPDEADPWWENPDHWRSIAYLYVALGDIAAARRLRGAASLLLDRACFGDPGEIMRGLRHQLEAIFNPDWPALTDIVLEMAKSGRLGTRLWAIDELVVLDDARARPIFEAALTDVGDIASLARIGLARLDRQHV